MLGNIVVRGAISTDVVENYRRPKNHLELEKVIAVAIHKFGYEVDLNWIDTSLVKDMQHMFSGAQNDKLYFYEEDGKVYDIRINLNQFNGDISRWDTSNVECMRYMFWKNSRFNGDISRWDVRKVRTFESMFEHSCFNQDINAWDVSGSTFDPIWGRRPDGFYRYYTCFNNMFKKGSMKGENVEAWGDKLDERFKSVVDMFTSFQIQSDERDAHGWRIWKEYTGHFPSWYVSKINTNLK